MAILNLVARQTKPVVLPHGTAHMSPASRMIHTLALGGLRTLGRGMRKKKVPRRLRTKASTGRHRKLSSKRRVRSARRKRVVRSHAHTRRAGHRLVKGSRAAKLHMAAIRKLRKSSGG